MATSFNLTLYVDDKPIGIAVQAVAEDGRTQYNINQNGSSKLNILPENFTIASDGSLVNGTGNETVEQLQIVRLIWQNISNVVSV